MNTSPEKLIIRPIVSGDDPAWPAWQEIYIDSFPLDERVPEAYFFTLFEQMQKGKERFEQVLVMEKQQTSATHDHPQVVAIAFVEHAPAHGICFLWYLATSTTMRSQGHGTKLYRWIVDKFEADKHLNQMFFEVEIPETAELADMASRRINWYRRLGAQLVLGIKYMQYVSPDIPPKEMFLMVHPLISADPAIVFAKAKAYFGDYLEQQGQLSLS